jgi:hypothetical protein
MLEKYVSETGPVTVLGGWEKERERERGRDLLCWANLERAKHNHWTIRAI